MTTTIQTLIASAQDGNYLAGLDLLDYKRGDFQSATDYHQSLNLYRHASFAEKDGVRLEATHRSSWQFRWEAQDGSRVLITQRQITKRLGATTEYQTRWIVGVAAPLQAMKEVGNFRLFRDAMDLAVEQAKSL